MSRLVEARAWKSSAVIYLEPVKLVITGYEKQQDNDQR